jgi:hypothetical protein
MYVKERELRDRDAMEKRNKMKQNAEELLCLA